MSLQVKTISANSVHAQVDDRQPMVLVDVRSPAEYRDGHAAGAVNIPLESINKERLDKDLNGGLAGDEKLILLCEAGQRAEQAAQRLQQEGLENLYVVEGGTSAWRQANLPIKARRTWLSLERQTQIALGSILMLILVKGSLLHPGFFLLVGLVGLGLVIAGVTARCSLTALIAKMPWNQSPGSTA